MSNFTAVDFFIPESYPSPRKDIDHHDFYLPPQKYPTYRPDPDACLVALEDLDRERRDPISTRTSSSLNKFSLLHDNVQPGQEFSPDAFQIPKPVHASPGECSDMQELGPEAFTLPGIKASVGHSGFSAENFELPVPKLPVKHADAPALRPEDFEIPVIKAPVQKLEMNTFGPTDFEIPNPSASQPGYRTLPPFSPTIIAELRFLGAEHPSVGDRGALSQSLETHLQVRRNVGNAGLRLLTLESRLVEQHFRTVDMIQTIDRSLALLSHTLVRQIPDYDTNYPPPMP